MPTATPPTLPTPVPLPTWTPIPTPVPGVLFVDAAQDRGPISPLVYGSGYGPWVSLRPQTIPLAQASGVTVLRYPGGAWGDQNDLQAYHIDQFAGVAREIVGAEPYIHVRFTGSTPAYAASVVKYANVDKGYGVRYWSIGNEPSLYEAAGDGWTAAEFAAEWRKFAEAMKAVDPTIQLIGPEIHQWAGIPTVDPKDSTGADWLRTFLQANGDLVDIVSIHRYPFPNNARRTSAEPDELRADAAEWTEIVRRLRDVVRTETGRDLPIAITEFNSHWSNSVGGDTTPDSHLSAIWLGDVLGRLIAEKVDMANQFLLVTGGDQGFGLLDRNGGRPAYFVYQLYKRFGDELVYSATDDPLTTVYAARRDDGALTILLVNLARRGGDEAAASLRISRPRRMPRSGGSTRSTRQSRLARCTWKTRRRSRCRRSL